MVLFFMLEGVFEGRVSLVWVRVDLGVLLGFVLGVVEYLALEAREARFLLEIVEVLEMLERMEAVILIALCDLSAIEIVFGMLFLCRLINAVKVIPRPHAYGYHKHITQC